MYMLRSVSVGPQRLKKGGATMKPHHMLLTLAALLTLALTSAAQNTKLKVLHNFGNAPDGSIPYGPLLLDRKGNLYGVTIDGGTGLFCNYGCGTVYELAPAGNGPWKEYVLHSFAGGSDGDLPWGGLRFDRASNLYGTLSGEPGAGNGIFELSPRVGGWTNTILYSGYAGPGLVFDKPGNLYGLIGGGSFGLGALGELSPSSGTWNYTDLYDFCPQNICATGFNLHVPPIWDAKGNLWGTTFEGGITQSPCITTLGCGVIYEVTPNGDGTWTYKVMYQFASSSTDGQLPYGGLVIDASGNFFGSTLGGGTYNQGTIFKFTYTGGQWVETILYDFPSCTLGCFPEGTLARDKAGNLYGMSQGGSGSCGGFTCGVVFKLAHQTNGTWSYSVLANLTPTTGGLPPFYGVTLDASGNLYGVTSSFGKYNAGTAFEITP
jgi:uncharacterized repeat protein (TIGR03803 family)